MTDQINPEITPEELGKKTFKVMMRPDGSGGFEKAIFIDGDLLDWRVDMNSYFEAMKMGPIFQKEIQKSIAEHFTESVSEFLGRKVTIEDIKTAIQTGWI